MPNNDSNWTTVTAKTKPKATSGIPTATKGSGPPAMPKAEVNTIKLSDSAFSSMKNKLVDPDENNEVDNPVQQSTPVSEHVPSAKGAKPSKSLSNKLTLQQALQNISVEKFKQALGSSNDRGALRIEKICYSFIEQLKDVSSGANDPIFSKETRHEYPVNALQTSVREYLNENFDMNAMLKAISFCRTGMLNPNADLNTVVGYQVLLQFFLRNLTERPADSFLNEIDELSTSLKRHPSDKVLRLLWAFGQLQYEYPGLDLIVWFRLMFPLVENRTYNQFVIEHLAQLTSRNVGMDNFLNEDEFFPIESFIKLLDFVDRPNPALTREMRASLTKSCSILSELFATNSENLTQNGNTYFKLLFPLIGHDKQRSTKSQSLIDRMIVACFEDKKMIKTWLSLHKKHPQSSLTLLPLLHNNEKPIAGVSSPKEYRAVVQQLRAISKEIVDRNGDNKQPDVDGHQTFLRIYSKDDTIVVNRRKSHSTSKSGSLFKLIVLLAFSMSIYYYWTWLSVAVAYLFEDVLKHPTVISIQQQLFVWYEQARKTCAPTLKRGEEYLRSGVAQIEPYAIKVGQHLQQQWALLLKYVEGPVYDKTIEIAEQIQQLSMVVISQCVHYLKIFFDLASRYAAQATQITEVYIKQLYEILYDKWIHLDTSGLRAKFDELRMRVFKSV